MVKFRVSLNLHNYNINSGRYSKQKVKKIHSFYKTLAELIKSTHNCDVRRTQKQFKEYSEPLIRIRKNIFTTALRDQTLPVLFQLIFPPTIDIDIEFKMTSEREETALRQFYKNYRGSVANKSYKELRCLYYSTKIINFVNRLRNSIKDNIFWARYANHTALRTKYKPIITVSEATVLSLT